MTKIVTIKSNNLDKSIKTKHLLEEKLRLKGFKTIDYMDERSELIVSIGGDGSFLKTVNDLNFSDKLFVGINTGHLGFFTDVSVEEIDEFITSYIENNYLIQTLPVLEVKISTEKEDINIAAINEAVIKCDKSKVIHANLFINENKIQKISGDGVIISTPVGSTAYNYSAKGSIVDTNLKVMQLTPLNPLNTSVYRTFTSSTLFSGESILEIVPEYRFEKSILIVIDGVEYKFEKVLSIKTHMTNQNIKLIRMPNYDFWSRVSEKLL